MKSCSTTALILCCVILEIGQGAEHLFLDQPDEAKGTVDAKVEQLDGKFEESVRCLDSKPRRRPYR